MSEEIEESEEGGDEGAPAWMATFADLMSLLLCFFVLLLSFATLDIIKFTQLVGSLSNAFGLQQEFIADYRAMSTSPIEFSRTQTSPDLDIVHQTTTGKAQSEQDRRLITEIQSIVHSMNMKEVVEVENEERGVVMRLNGEALFESGSATLRKGAHAFLLEVGEIANRMSNEIRVEGHSDNQPISSTRYPSNWHLASARAIATLQFLTENSNLDPGRTSAVSYGPTRPLVPNDTERERSINRRVEFVFVRESHTAVPRYRPGTPARVLDEAGVFD